VIYFLSLLPATALTIGGYLTWYLAERSQGPMRSFGRFLGFWAFALAALVILGAIFAAGHAGHRGFMRMHPGWHAPWPADPRFAPPPPRGPGGPAADAPVAPPPAH
jgi:heme A synthase